VATWRRESTTPDEIVGAMTRGLDVEAGNAA